VFFFLTSQLLLSKFNRQVNKKQSEHSSFDIYSWAS